MLFSLDKLEKLMQNDSHAQKSFVDLFVSEIQENDLPILDKAIKDQNIKAIKAKAHSIKSNTRFFGLEKISSELQNIEDWPLEEPFFDELSSKIHLVKISLDEVCTEMKEWSKNQNAHP